MENEANSLIDTLKKEIQKSIYHEFDFYLSQTIQTVIQEELENIRQEQIKIEIVQKDMIKMFVGYQEMVQEHKKYCQLQTKQINEVKELLRKINSKE